MAQRADDNATTSAEDAFGSSLGNESVGLYNPYEARGFSPNDAGNVRIEGLYFDQQDEPTSRLVENTRVRVGLTTLGFLFPAPTGIADYSLRKAEDKRVISVVAGTGVYNGPYIEVDTKFPLIGEKLGLAAGVARRHEEYFDGADGDFTSYGATLGWRPRDGVEVLPFFGRVHYWNEESTPIIITGGDFIPPPSKRRRFFSQEWADNEGYSQNHGLIAKADLNSAWTLQAGLFQSRFIADHDFSELLVNVDQNGVGERLVVARKDQRFASTSGEVRLSYNFIEGPRKHTVHAALLGRDSSARSGGASVVSLGPGLISVSDQEPVPAFTFGPLNRDTVRQGTFGVAYQGLWPSVGEFSAGLQRSDYRKVNVQQVPVPARSVRRDKPWLWNATGALYITGDFAVYGGYTRGLEESGNAPADAVNRFEVLPAIRTSQREVGARMALTADLKLVTGIFDVRKPYFALDNAQVFRELGQVRHRGAELSLTGQPMENLTVVIGAVFMRPRVTGEPVDRGEIGKKPVGQTGRTIRASFDYRLPFWDGVSVDGLFQNIGKRIGSVDNKAVVPGRAVLDLGARYAFTLSGNPATLRFRVANITNKFGYRVLGDHAFQFNQARHVSMYLATDF